MLLFAVLTVCPVEVMAQGRRAVAAEDPARSRALELFAESTTAYREGRFHDAAALLREAYGLHPEPILLYNLARALEADGQLDDARDAYQEFLAASPDAEQAAPSRRRLEVIEGMIAEREARVEVVEPEPEPEPAPVVETPRAAPDTTGPWVLLGSSVAVAAAGGVLLGVASLRYDQALAEPVHLMAANLEREAFALRDAGAVVLGIGGVAAIASSIWLIAASSTGGSEPAVAVRVGPLGVHVSGRF